jgi:peptidoglycan/LPS O-acetylase OafA/YrhL
MMSPQRERRRWIDVGQLWNRPTGQLPALDALRAAAILLVIGAHYTAELGVQHLPAVAASRFASIPLIYWGWTGVDLFFILSGYLIGRQLWKERLETGTVRFGRFVLRRGFRIWPLYFFMLLAYVLSGRFRFSWWDVAFVSNYYWTDFNRGWSLSTEEQFYILVPLVLLASTRIRRPIVYAWGLGLVVIAVWFFRWHALQEYLARGLSGHDLKDHMYSQFHLHCEPLVAGLAIALASVAKPDWFRVEKGQGFSRRGFTFFVVASAVGVALRTLSDRVFPFTALALIYGSLAVWLMLDRSWVQQVASWRVFYPISRLSYGMYLNHFYVLPMVTVWTVTALRVRGASEPVWFFGGLLAGTATSMLVAAMTFLLVEHPFLELRDRRLRTRHEPASPAVEQAPGQSRAPDLVQA